jgi:hypothetical protein
MAQDSKSQRQVANNTTTAATWKGLSTSALSGRYAGGAVNGRRRPDPDVLAGGSGEVGGDDVGGVAVEVGEADRSVRRGHRCGPSGRMDVVVERKTLSGS